MIANFLTHLPTSLRVLVVGDVVIDERHEGTVNRLSPESPVPILQTSNTPIRTVGGAANVCRQLKALGMKPTLLSLLAESTRELLREEGIDTTGSLDSFRWHNCLKRRFYAGDRCLLRQDIDTRISAEGALLASFNKAVSTTDLVIFSDYGKGVFNESSAKDMVLACCKQSKLSIVDPKYLFADNWAGCTVFKPNAAEALAISGTGHRVDDSNTPSKELVRQVAQLHHLTKASIVITRGDKAPSVYDGLTLQACSDGPAVHARNVSGAGDCFTAFLGAALHLGIAEAAEVAHAAARCYVTHPRGEPVTRSELLASVDPIAAKIAPDPSWLTRQTAGKRVIVAPGTFRIPHQGHFALLSWARQQGDVLIVAMNSDASVSRIKPGAKCLPWQQRAQTLAGLCCVDYILPFEEDTPESLYLVLSPAAQVKGPEYTGQSIPGSSIAPVLIAPPLPYTRHASDLC